VLWRYEKVDMVGHQHIGMDVCPMPLRCGRETVEVAGIVIFGNKNGRAVIPALNYMLGLAEQKVPRESCHLGRLDTADEQMDKSSLTPFSQGDNRGPTCNDPTATYRYSQMVYGNGTGPEPRVGVSTFLPFGISLPGVLGKNATKPVTTAGRKDSRNIRIRGAASDGIFLGAAPDLEFDITIVESVSGSAYVRGLATAFPSLEVCQYTDSGSRLIYQHNSTGGPWDLIPPKAWVEIVGR
jgi:hypothetical protein